MCVCVCVSAREQREGGREGGRQKEREGGRKERESRVCTGARTPVYEDI